MQKTVTVTLLIDEAAAILQMIEKVPAHGTNAMRAMLRLDAKLREALVEVQDDEEDEDGSA